MDVFNRKMSGNIPQIKRTPSSMDWRGDLQINQ
jgi:hypothetical protein